MCKLPQKFIEYISQYEQLAPLGTSLLTEPSLSIRLNRRKASAEALDGHRKVAWCDYGYYLDARPQFTFDPALHQGRYYVQDASSMAICAVLKEIAGDKPVRYLDACASPGGKTTAAIDTLPDGSLIVANEYDPKRAAVLVENLAKWGCPNAMAIRGDAARIGKLKHFFDIIAVDAPCSGEGMMRKDPQAVEQWSESLIRECAATQRHILEGLWQALKPGGMLIYSTCTFNRLENEENLAWLVDQKGAIPVEISTLADIDEITAGIDTHYPCYRFLPGKTDGEGLFMAVVKKPGCDSTCKPNKAAPKAKDNKDMQKAAAWLRPGYSLALDGDTLYALPEGNASAMREIKNAFVAISMGVKVATIKGKDLIPEQELALSTALNPEAFDRAEIGYATAISYLKRQALSGFDKPKGYLLLTYQGYPLGFVKNLGNRSNNLYPMPWRILSQQVPEHAPRVI